MTLDQINELINRGVVGLVLGIIAFILAFAVFSKKLEK